MSFLFVQKSRGLWTKFKQIRLYFQSHFSGSNGPIFTFSKGFSSFLKNHKKLDHWATMAAYPETPE